MKRRRGRHVSMVVTGLAIVILVVAIPKTWPHLVFRWRFEAVGVNAKGYPEYRHRQTGIVFVRLPGGTFWMGAQKEDPNGQNYDPLAQADEGPVHQVTVSPFLIGKYPVTQAEWYAVIGNYPSYFDGTNDLAGRPVNSPESRDQLPVERVSWDDIQEFEKKTALRLPTEAQWEYSCRGGTETAFWFGSGENLDDWDSGVWPERDAAVWWEGNAKRRPHPVGTKAANPVGIHDMPGLVHEWCEDAYSPGSYSLPELSGTDPLCTLPPGSYTLRKVRGACTGARTRFFRSAVRLEEGPQENRRFGAYGFRAAYWPCP